MTTALRRPNPVPLALRAGWLEARLGLITRPTDLPGLQATLAFTF